jgi:hypothetical protein
MTPRKPVTDWATDWDHLDPRWREDPFPIWDELRRSCPIAHTERYQGAYLPTRYEDVRAIANDSTHFSSRRVIVREVRPEPIPSPPITSDPPHHKPYKQLLLPPFTAEAMTRLEPKARAICNELIDKFIADGNCDAAQQYTRHIPVKVIAHMLGVPETDSNLFIRWIHEILELGITDDAVLMQAIREMAGYFAGHIAGRRQSRAAQPAEGRPDQPIAGGAYRRQAPRRSAPERHAAAVADCRDRHDLERHRRRAVASRPHAG